MASQDSKDQDPRIVRISSAIRVIPNFPKPGQHSTLSLHSLIHRFILFFIWLYEWFGFIEWIYLFIHFRYYVSRYNHAAAWYKGFQRYHWLVCWEVQRSKYFCCGRYSSFHIPVFLSIISMFTRGVFELAYVEHIWVYPPTYALVRVFERAYKNSLLAAHKLLLTYFHNLSKRAYQNSLQFI